jgi:hypothetical protein
VRATRNAPFGSAASTTMCTAGVPPAPAWPSRVPDGAAASLLVFKPNTTRGAIVTAACVRPPAQLPILRVVILSGANATVQLTPFHF